MKSSAFPTGYEFLKSLISVNFSMNKLKNLIRGWYLRYTYLDNSNLDNSIAIGAFQSSSLYYLSLSNEKFRTF